MAIEKRVNVIVSAVDKYSSVMTGFAGNWKLIGGAVIAAEAAIIAFSIKLASLTVDMAKTFVSSAADFHDAIYDVTAVAQSFGTTSDDVSEVLTDMTIKFPLTGKAAGEALEQIAQMGFGTEEQLTRVSEAAVTLSIATGKDMDTAVKSVTATLNQFGLGVEDVERVTNLFAAAQFSSAASIDKLNEAMKFAGPVAKLLGMSLEDTVAVLAQLVQQGLEGSQAGTTLRMAIAQVFKESEHGEEALKKLGLTYQQLQEAMADTSSFMELFEGKTIEVKEAFDLLGVRSNVLASLINMGAEQFNEYRDSITGTQAAVDALDLKMKKWSVVVDMVEGDLDVLKKTIGEGLLEAIIETVGTDENSGIRGMITQIRNLEEQQHLIGGPLLDAFNNLREVASNMFRDTFGDAQGFYNWLGNIALLLGKNAELVGQWALMWAGLFAEGTKDREDVKTWLQVINVAFGALSITIAMLHDLFVGFIYGVKLGFAGMQTAWYTIEGAIKKGIKNIYLVLSTLPGLDYSKEIAAINTELEKVGRDIKAAWDIKAPQLWTDDVVKLMAKTSNSIDQMSTSQKGVTEEVKMTADQVRKLGENFEYVDGKVKEIKVEQKNASDIMPEWARGMEYVFEAAVKAGEAVKDAPIKELGGDLEKAGTEADKLETRLTDTGITVTRLADGTLHFSNNMGKAGTEVEKVSKDIDKTKESLSEMEKFELELEKKQFEHDLEMVELGVKNLHEEAMKLLELEAKLKVAQVEADAKKVVAAFEQIGESVQSAAKASADMFSSLAGMEGSPSEKWFLQDILEDQMEIQKDLADSQIKLTNAQAELIETQIEALKSEGLKINVNVQGDTEGWLSGLLSSLLDEIFIRAEAEGFQCFGV